MIRLDKIREILPIGSIVDATVTQHETYGFFAKISEIPIPGLVEINQILDDNIPGDEKEKEIWDYFPRVGTKFRGVVLGYSQSADDEFPREIGLGIKPSQLRNAELGLDPHSPVDRCKPR